MCGSGDGGQGQKDTCSKVSGSGLVQGEEAVVAACWTPCKVAISWGDDKGG